VFGDSGLTALGDIDFTTQEWISARIITGFPGLDRFFLSKDAAKELRIPVAIRYLSSIGWSQHPALKPMAERWDRTLCATVLTL